MPRREPPTRQRWIRSLVVLVAALLGLAGVCLVVFGTTQKQLQIGVLLGLWAALIGAFLMFGARRGQAEQAAVQLAEAEQRARELHEAQLQVSALQQTQIAAAEQARNRQEVELRKLGEIQLSREVAARREADLHLELSLRREIERMMNEQIGLLRDEVAALRAEVVDKLGGQLRLERIETTRLIGSDLEALQHEIRRLARTEGNSAGLGAAPSQLTGGRPAATGRPDAGHAGYAAVPAGWRQDTGHAEIVDAELIESGQWHGGRAGAEPVRPAAAWSEPTVVRAEPAAGPTAPAVVPADPSAVAPDPVAAAPDTAVPLSAAAGSYAAAEPKAAGEPRAAVEPRTETGPRATARQTATAQPNAPARPTATAQQASDPFDLFAGLPRLSPVPEDLELIPDRPTAAEPADQADGRDHEQPGGYERTVAGSGYHGRRRAAEDEAGPQPPGGRRRAPDDAPDDLFARLRQP